MTYAELDQVSVRFGRRRLALDRVSVRAEQGLVALLGPNGAGKTTLLRLLATATRPSAGTVSILGQAIGRRTHDRQLGDLRRRVGYLPQDCPLIDAFRVDEYVAYLGWTRGMSLDQARQAAPVALARVELSGRAGDKIKHLSGGMRQRVGLAQAIVNDPDVVVLDEPTVGLDPRQRASFRALIVQLAQDRLVVISTHLVEDVAQWDCPVVVIDEGRVVFSGPTERLVALGQQSGGTGSDIERGYFGTLDQAGQARLDHVD